MFRLLKLADDLNRHFIRLCCPDDRRESGHTTIYQLDTPGAELDIIDRAVQMTIQARFAIAWWISGLVKDVPPARENPGIGSGCNL